MRLQCTVSDTKHADFVTSVGWNGGNELYSVSDDMTVGKWSVDGVHEGQVCPLEVNATDMHWFPVRNSKTASDVFVVACTDGSFLLMTKGGRIEKKVDKAHKFAVISIRWSHEGTAIATGGEDGVVKIWSRSGMLRSTLATNDSPVHGVSWGPDSERVVFAVGNELVHKPLQSNAKQVKWKAHEGVVLCVEWSAISNLIISGGEDCRYKVWDSFGRMMFQSKPTEHPITSVAWSPNGEHFAVGFFDCLRLCDKSGFALSKSHIRSGSITSIGWTTDGTQLAGAGANGSVVFGQVVERKCEWMGIEATLGEHNRVTLFDVSSDVSEEIDFRDRVVCMSLGFGFLVVTTATQCCIYSLASLPTPQIFDVREVVHFILQSERYFLTSDSQNGLGVFTYDGRPQNAPKFPGMRPDLLTPQTVSISNEFVACVDHADQKSVRIFDITSGKQVGEPIKHNIEIASISLNKVGKAAERKLTIIDRNRDLHVTLVTSASAPQSKKAPSNLIVKLGTMTDSAVWNEKADILAALMDGKFVVWYYPNVVFVDRDLIADTRVTTEGTMYGKDPQICSFYGDHCCVRKCDGTLLYESISPYPAALQTLVLSSDWERAIQLCRHLKDRMLWATLAAMAIHDRELNTAEVAFAAIDEVDKLRNVLHIKDIPTVEGRNAELALWRRRPEEAEQILLQAGLIYRAIRLHIRLFNWDRALEIAAQHKQHIDTVVAFRQRYLQQFGRTETNPRFIQFAEAVTVDWDKVMASIKAEKEKEAKRPGAKPLS